MNEIKLKIVTKNLVVTHPSYGHIPQLLFLDQAPDLGIIQLQQPRIFQESIYLVQTQLKSEWQIIN